MRVLILGGTRFVGRRIVEELLERGHRVSLVHRGTTDPNAFAGSEHLIGDRSQLRDLIDRRTWDAVVDTSGYVPHVVAASASVLKRVVGRYLFISTISVYEAATSPISEASPMLSEINRATDTVTPATYGPLKVMCERALQDAFGPNHAIVRPGLIVGPGDYTDRFSFWPIRMVTRTAVLVPAVPRAPVQYVDGRDLAAFVTTLLESASDGSFNVAGPTPHLEFGAFVSAVAAACDSQAKFVTVPPDVLRTNGVMPWSDLPLIASYDATEPSLFRVDATKAIEAGFRQRALAVTVRDTVAWWRAQGGFRLKAGLSPEAENRLIHQLSSADR